jgi:hypothetical protein
MPYIPPKNRPAIDAAVEKLAKETADHLTANNIAGSISEDYRKMFMEISNCIVLNEAGQVPSGNLSAAQELGKAIIEMAESYNLQGGWQGELNYAITRLIQWVPFEMYQRGEWSEALRYWLYAQTVGALVRTSYEIDDKFGNEWAANGLAGVFEDIKDEYKRRVNTAYERLQISKSGDCYEKSPFKTQLTEFEHNGIKGWIEIMLPQQEPK